MPEPIKYQTLLVVVDGETLADNDKVLPATAKRLFLHLRDIHRYTDKNVVLNITTLEGDDVASFVRESSEPADWREN